LFEFCCKDNKNRESCQIYSTNLPISSTKTVASFPRILIGDLQKRGMKSVKSGKFGGGCRVILVDLAKNNTKKIVFRIFCLIFAL
jgi:hypothetical protein